MLTRKVKEEAYRLGFDLIGVTTPDPPPHAAAYVDWLALGRHGQMEYLARERALALRLDPRQVLPGCRSVLVLGIRYPVPNLIGERSSRSRLTGRISSYACGEDYHDVLLPRLHALVNSLERLLGRKVTYRPYSDTGPVLERDLAQRAGLGWIGKNTCLINPTLGSYFFLAEIFLDVALNPDEPFAEDRCGTCRRCIEACPTACIMPDRTIDAGRCISYLTIENKGEIPPDLRPLMADWIFGCDVCQMVCPWNRFARGEFDEAFAPRPEVAVPDLRVEISLTPADFNRKFRTSPIRRARRRGYLRNIAVALGNSCDPEALPALKKALEDREDLVRSHAAWALQQLGEFPR